MTYLQLRSAPAAPEHRCRSERIGSERLAFDDYLALYRKVGGPWGWDQRLLMPEGELRALLELASLIIYVLRDERGAALGFCEFDRREFPEVELKNFGLVPEAQGKGLGPWLLRVALGEEWTLKPARIWLHTDTCDHPAAIRVYEQAGLQVYAVRDEEAGPS